MVIALQSWNPIPDFFLIIYCLLEMAPKILRHSFEHTKHTFKINLQYECIIEDMCQSSMRCI